MEFSSNTEGSPGGPLEAFARTQGTSSPRQAMARLCEELREKAGQATLPIDLRPLLSHLGVELAIESGTAEAVLRRRNPRGWSIGMPKDSFAKSRQRSRFTIAHELGHILVISALQNDPKALKALRTREYWKPIELLCNYAAAELLVPEREIHAELMRSGISGRSLVRLRQTFDVSWEALWVRISETVPGLTVVPWKYHSRPGKNERQAFRVLRTFGGRTSGVWLPEGLTSRYLQPDLVSDAVSSGEAYAPDLQLNIKLKANPEITAIAISSELFYSGTEPGLFDSPSMPREAYRGPDAVLLILASSFLENNLVRAVWAATLESWRERNGVVEEPSSQLDGVATGQMALPLGA